MKLLKEALPRAAKSAAEKALKRNANSTTCISFYQPKAPEALKKFQTINQNCGRRLL